jgi:ABC-type transport system substrate-binding protein
MCISAVLAAGADKPQEELLHVPIASGRYGGVLRIAQRAELKTLNPVIALDGPSREVIRRTTADLITINRQSQQTEPGLAKSWTISKDGREYVLELRRGLRFSDGQPFDAGDVVFTFQVYLDEKLHSPQRDLLMSVSAWGNPTRPPNVYSTASPFSRGTYSSLHGAMAS